MKSVVVLAAFIILFASPTFSQDCHDAEKTRHEDVDRRGDHAMGFSHETSRHTFKLHEDGGLIAATAKSAGDAATRDQIRGHMKHIAQLFAAGDFSAPVFIHDRVPPGVETMKALPEDIQYRYVELAEGGAVRITTSNPKALAAIHAFLRFQIEDHRTGDSMSTQ